MKAFKIKSAKQLEISNGAWGKRGRSYGTDGLDLLVANAAHAVKHGNTTPLTRLLFIHCPSADQKHMRRALGAMLRGVKIDGERVLKSGKAIAFKVEPSEIKGDFREFGKPVATAAGTAAGTATTTATGDDAKEAARKALKAAYRKAIRAGIDADEARKLLAAEYAANGAVELKVVA